MNKVFFIDLLNKNNLLFNLKIYVCFIFEEVCKEVYLSCNCGKSFKFI